MFQRQYFTINPTTVVDKPGKIINENFLKFASFFNFTLNACNPYSPNEKGTDEETVGMVRNSCFSEKNDFDSLDDANKYLKDKLSRNKLYACIQKRANAKRWPNKRTGLSKSLALRFATTTTLQ